MPTEPTCAIAIPPDPAAAYFAVVDTPDGRQVLASSADRGALGTWLWDYLTNPRAGDISGVIMGAAELAESVASTGAAPRESR